MYIYRRTEHVEPTTRKSNIEQASFGSVFAGDLPGAYTNLSKALKPDPKRVECRIDKLELRLTLSKLLNWYSSPALYETPVIL